MARRRRIRAKRCCWLDAHKRKLGHFINGKWHAPSDNQYFETTDPSTGEPLAAVAQGSSTDIDAAVRAARAALPAWQSLTDHARSRYLYALARLVQKHSRRLAVLETMDNGKPIRESRDLEFHSWPATFTITRVGRNC